MAKVTSAWGIDIGQCALKAICCGPAKDNPQKIIAEAFDYIEYSKILSQPEADPEEMVREALQLFLSRNDLRGTTVSVSVSGQSGLARFIKLPPVEVKKIPDIVRYEANQQIPFDLEDVIWDYQRMFGGSEEEGFALDAEIGLFAMKRDQVFQEIVPYEEASIDIDIVQLTPLAIYNFVAFDQIDASFWKEEYDPSNPPESIIVLSIGTEATDLVITNGYRVWQRNVPLGGSHFTKALVKELQLTYAKAEHLKRNATRAEDPKALYQAMRPIFKDLLTEIQRSMGYFQSLDKEAKISRVLALGNSLKLPGLERYLQKNLGFEVEHLTEMRTLTSSVVTQSPAFNDNLSAFAVPYGLAIQGLSKAAIGTNLIPQELVWDRTIQRKKPWALATTAVLGVACLLNFIVLWWSWSQVQVDSDQQWLEAAQEAKRVVKKADDLQRQYQEVLKEYESQQNLMEKKIAIFERNKDYLNLCQAIYQCLPDETNRTVVQPEEAPTVGRSRRTESEERRASESDESNETSTADSEIVAKETSPKDTPEKKVDKTSTTTDRMDVWITDLCVRKVPNLARWFSGGNKSRYNENVESLYVDNAKKGGEETKLRTSWKGKQDQDSTVKEFPAPKKNRAPTKTPKGPGYIVQLSGYHFHNSPMNGSGKKFIQRTLIHNLQERNIALPDPNGGVSEKATSELGISHPLVFEADEKVVISPFKTDQDKRLTQYRFVVQFAWKPQEKEKP